MHDMRSGRCPLCDHRVILEAAPAEFAENGLEVSQAVTYDARWVLGGRNPKYPHGRMMLYVCRACGYCQYFADGASAIPVGQEYRTRLIEGPPQGDPYR